ncbi:MAG: Ni/Fe-hydrogenase, b-type cytochrome subunit [Acidobacteriaceae bacterium]|nr:Ni/Fe-hydrogenase, b-type cytochrome subunit [Acidobacteriaceae bacterium]MBV8571165.1 Ni/Fe-hydrogenase, b-type cytochrome subunit [Acidobacteriaceae bacterium]
MASGTVNARIRPEASWVRVYVWQLPVRLAHWILVGCLVVLSFTGIYIHNPFIVAVSDRSWVMGTMRFIHVMSGFVLISALIWRFYWFFAGNRWARWDQFVPFTKERRSAMKNMMEYYGFLRWWPAPQVGHNPLAGAAYCAVFGLLIIEILTGLALFDNILGNRVLHSFIGWLTLLINLQYLRMIHFGIMFLFGAFLIHHVYSAILISKEERSGLMDSIFTGYKYISPARLSREGVGERVERH